MDPASPSLTLHPHLVNPTDIEVRALTDAGFPVTRWLPNDWHFRATNLLIVGDGLAIDGDSSRLSIRYSLDPHMDSAPLIWMMVFPSNPTSEALVAYTRELMKAVSDDFATLAERSRALAQGA